MHTSRIETYGHDVCCSLSRSQTSGIEVDRLMDLTDGCTNMRFADHNMETCILQAGQSWDLSDQNKVYNCRHKFAYSTSETTTTTALDHLSARCDFGGVEVWLEISGQPSITLRHWVPRGRKRPMCAVFIL